MKYRNGEAMERIKEAEGSASTSIPVYGRSGTDAPTNYLRAFSPANFGVVTVCCRMNALSPRVLSRQCSASDKVQHQHVCKTFTQGS